VDRAVELLLLLGRRRRDMGVTELAKELGVQKSTAHSLLQTLMLRGFVRQTDTGRYTLGYGLIRLGEACAEQLDIRGIARPFMNELADETEEIALLAVLSGTELIIVEKAEPQKPFFIIPKFDFSITLHSTAIGKVLLANAPTAIIDEVLARGVERFTSYTLTDREALLKELAQVREQGFAVGCNETIEGVTCIAVPVYDSAGKVAAALSVSSASSMLAAQRYETLVRLLKEKAGKISRRLGYQPA
jgi:IclR family acetate operon transcriptional repressor